MGTHSTRAVLFVKDLDKAAAFYIGALAMRRLSGDDDHVVLEHDGFEIVVHRIPKQIADTIVITQPPVRRVWAALRLDFPVSSAGDCRRLARALGGDVDDAPPPWADPKSSFYFGYDPEGNQFGVSERS
jgi:catechol 2,3-dioxygenase-like lactoylglutathione lyase family enzyme